MNMLAVNDRAKQLSGMGISGHQPGMNRMKTFPQRGGGQLQQGGAHRGAGGAQIKPGSRGRVPRAARPSAVIAGARRQVGGTPPSGQVFATCLDPKRVALE